LREAGGDDARAVDRKALLGVVDDVVQEARSSRAWLGEPTCDQVLPSPSGTTRSTPLPVTASTSAASFITSSLLWL
jgi:hypothetical protein